MKKGTSHKSQIDRLSKIEGQVRGVIRMIDHERYCIDIPTQLRSLQSALRSVEREIVHAHIEFCVKSAVESGSPREIKEHLKEISELLSRTCK